MPADSVFITELIVDGSQLESGVARSITSLNTIVDASNRAAESVDRLGAALDRAGRVGDQSRQATSGIETQTRALNQQAEAQRVAAAAGEQAETVTSRQGAAATSSAAVIARLTATLQQVTAAQNNLKDSMAVGSVEGIRATEWATLGEQRIRQLTAAIAAMEAGASEASVMERFPKAFEAMARGAELTSNSFIATARGTLQLAESMTPLDAAIARVRANLTSLVSAYDPIAASARRTMQEIGQLDAAFRAGEVGAKQYSEIFGRITAAQNEAAAAVRKNADMVTTLRATYADQHPLPPAPLTTDVLAQKQSAESAQTLALAESAQKVRDQMDPASAAFARYNAQVAQYDVLLNTINPKTKQAYLSQIEHNAAVNRAAAEHLSAVSSFHAMGAAVDSTNDKVKESTRQHLLNRNGMQELRAAGVNSFQALAAGMDPLFVAQMEGAQVIGAVVQGTNITLAQTAMVIAPIVALAAAFAIVAGRVASVTSDLRMYNMTLTTIASGSSVTAGELLALQNHLRDTGSSAKDAQAAIQTVARAAPRGVSPEAVAIIPSLARDIATETGGEMTEETKKLTDALAGGVDEMAKYALGLGAITSPQAAAMRQLEEHGQKANAMRVAIAALAAMYGGAYDRSLSETQRLMISLKNVWNDVVDALANSEFTESFLNGLGIIGRALRDLLKDSDRLKDTLDRYAGVAAGAAAGARVAGIPGALVGGGLAYATDTRLSDAKVVAETSMGFWDTFSKKWDDLQETLGHGRPGDTNREDFSSSSQVTSREDLAQALRERGATEQEVQRTIANGITAQNANTEAVRTLTVAQQAAAAGTTAGSLSVGGAVSGVFAGATEAENSLLSQIRQRESSNNYSIFNAQGSSASGAFQMIDSTWQRWSTASGFGGQYKNAAAAPADVQNAVALHGLRTEGTRPWDASSPPGGYRPFVGGTGPILDVGASLGGASTLGDQRRLIQDNQLAADAAAKQETLDEKHIGSLKLLGNARELDQAKVAAENSEIVKGLSGQAREEEIKRQVAVKARELAIERGHNAEGARIEASETLKTAEAYGRSTVAGLQAAAMTQAVLQSRTGNITKEEAYNKILDENATKAISSAAAQARAMNPVIEGNVRLAEAAKVGGAALRDAEIHNDAVARSQDAVNKALATGNTALAEHAKRTQDDNEKQLQTIEALKQTTTARTEINKSTEQVAAVKLETALQGLPPDQITAQLSLLRARQRLQDELSHATPEVKQDYIDQATALARANLELAEAERRTQRVNDAVRSVGHSIENDLTQRISDAFDGKKAQSWGETMRGILKSLLVQITEFAFIKPLIGTALGLLGFGAAAQGFGSFGSLFGDGGGSSGSPTGATTVGGAGSTFDTLKQGAGVAKSGFDLFGDNAGGSIFGKGGFTGWLNNDIGGSLGFGTPLTNTGGLSVAELKELGFPSVTPGSVFGSTTLGGALGGIGIGAGAGGLLASLTGGNPTLGSVGGGFGGLGGTLLAPLLGIAGPFGAIAGGLLGGVLGGMFGNNKPSTLASGAMVDLATGRVGDFSSSGNAQNDQQVKQISKSLGDFAGSVQKLTGGTVDGSLNVVATTKGIETHYSGSLGKIDAKFADAESAIKGLELAIAQNLTGIGDTLKTALAHITDPSQVQSAVQFAATYDDLKKAVDSAFSGIPNDVKTVGQFQTALENINKTFKDLGTQATEFGLALDPITAGLQEATKRLQQDFGKSLDQALNQASGNEFIDKLTGVSQDFATNSRDAVSIGLGDDATTTAKVAQLEALQAQKILSELSVDQLQKVVEKFAQTNPEISAMAQAILSTGNAAVVATSSINDLSGGIKSLETLATSLRSGTLSGLPPAQQAKADAATFFADLKAVQSAGQNVTSQQLTDLASAGQAAIEGSKTAYGEAPQTADLRKQILAAIDAVTGTTGPSGATHAETAAAQALNIASLPAVQAAQTAAAAAATAGVTSKVVVPNATTPAAPSAAPAAVPSAAPATAVVPAAASTASNLDAMVARYIAGTASIAEQQTITNALNAGQLLPAQAAKAQAAWASIYQYSAQYQTLPGFAMGSSFTPPGAILVGENGPEIVVQQGGAAVIPISQHAAYQWHGPSYAGGAGDMGSLLHAVVGELAALRRQTLGGQKQAAQDASKQIHHQAEIASKVSAAPPPARQNLGRR